MTNENDHDLLIAIRTNTENHQENFLRYIESNAKDHETFEKGIGAAHRRIDYLLGTVIVGVIGLIVTVIIAVKLV